MTSAPSTFSRSGTALADRVLDCFPSGAYALSGLLRLMDIVEDESVLTAAVECRVQPLLRINPGFVAAHAATPERLLMLVMHELHHVLLGHTTLFPTPTPAHNFVFDAVINGVISRMFPAPEYTSLLTGHYDAESFPKCLLRPPPGWPDRPQIAGGVLTLEEPLRSRARDIHSALYSEAGASYREVFQLLPKLLGKDIGDIPLLGGHAEDGAAKGGLEHRSPVLFDIVRGVVEQWPQPPHPIRGRSLASILETDTIQPKRPTSARATLRSLIRRVASSGPSGDVRQPAVDTHLAPLPLPTLGRRTSVLRALGYEPLLHVGPVPSRRRRVPAGRRVHVYLDVSGSMDGVKGALYGAILDCEVFVHPTVHLFSTEVADISLSELRAGVCKSTGGTDIVCVAAHMEANRVRRGLIVTDGWVGEPRGHHRHILSSAKLAVAYLGFATNTQDLAPVADFTAPLTIGV